MAVKKGEGTHAVTFSRVTIPRSGENLTGWYTRPNDRGVPGVVLVPEAWGVTGFHEALGHVLSRNGFACLAVEPYSRGDKPKRSASREVARAAFAQLSVPQIVGDARAALEFLRRTDDVDSGRLGVIGLGDGGLAAASLAADSRQAARGLILLYADPGDPVPPLVAPVLALYGGKDECINAAVPARLGAAAAVAKVKQEILVYPDAGAGFIDDERDTFDPASAADAWDRVLRFLGTVFG